MKKLFFSLLFTIGLFSLSYAGVEKGTPFMPGDQNVVVVKDSISSSVHWTNNNVYIIQGWVYVISGATVTIDPGTVVVGDKDSKGTLIFERGSKIMAVGTKDQPIVFTSNQEQKYRTQGDWGGIMLCGNAPTNWNAGEQTVEGGPRSKYGGTDAHDNSGKMRYCRIEFAGIALQPNNETNGLTLCAVGDATEIDHIQVSLGGDDSYEFFGGTVNAKYLVSFLCWDDDFDTDCGYTGNVQFGVVVRGPQLADVSGSKAFESDAYQSGTASGLAGDTSKITKPVFSNFTVVGPLAAPANNTIAPEFVSAVQIRRGSGMSLLNSVILGWPCDVLIDESSASYGSTSANIGTDLLQFRNNIIAATATYSTPANKEIIYVKDGARSLTATTAFADTTTGSPFAPFSGPIGWLKSGTSANKVFAGSAGSNSNTVKLTNPFPLANGQNFGSLSLVPLSASPICFNNTNLPSYIPAGTFPLNKYPYDPKKPINTDTSNLFANYNAPDVVPDFTNSKASNSFFTKTNHVGAFNNTSVGATDNWMQGWTNFDPNDTYYIPTGISKITNSFIAVNVVPNPASNTASLRFELISNTNLKISLFDLTGKQIQEVFNGNLTAGKQNITLDLTNFNTGLYFATMTAENQKQTVKFNVVK